MPLEPITVHASLHNNEANHALSISTFELSHQHHTVERMSDSHVTQLRERVPHRRQEEDMKVMENHGEEGGQR